MAEGEEQTQAPDGGDPALAAEAGAAVPFDEDPAPTGAGFVVDLAGYEGPIDVLLTLARDQKVDLRHISIVALADQYLAFVQEARRQNLELAADYLVMAAWLAYLKSRLLLPDLSAADQPTGEEMAAALQFQLQRLEGMQKAGQALMERPQLGRDVFARGMPEKFATDVTTVLDVTLYDLLKAYGDQKRRQKPKSLTIEAWSLYSVDDALQRLRRVVGFVPDWQSLWRFLPEMALSGLTARSATASTFVACLELAKEGKLALRQDGTYGPIFLKSANRVDRDDESAEAVPAAERENSH